MISPREVVMPYHLEHIQQVNGNYSKLAWLESYFSQNGIPLSMYLKQHRLVQLLKLRFLNVVVLLQLFIRKLNLSTAHFFPQLFIMAVMTMTVFIRTELDVDLESANYFMGSLYYALVRLMTNGVAELSLTNTRLPVVDKQRTFYLYPAWAYSIPASILKIPFSVVDALLWTALTYYVIGYSPEVKR